MNWARKPQSESPKHRKEWRGGRSRYRIIWRDRVFSVTVPAGYQCCVREYVPEIDTTIWALIRRTVKNPFYRTMKTAKDACERHANPDYKPVRKKRKKKGKTPEKACPECGGKSHVRKALCSCGYKFPRKLKKKKKKK